MMPEERAEAVPPLSAADLTRFLSHLIVNPDHPAGCVIQWDASVNDAGYGRFGLAGRAFKAHRVSAALAGMDVAGSLVMHACDNPPCVTPTHLSVGTNADNMADMIAKRRSAGGTPLEMALRTHCPRGHALAGANLAPCQAARGKRSCQVCDRASNAVRTARLRGYAHIPTLAEAIANELSRTDGGRDLVAIAALGHDPMREAS